MVAKLRAVRVWGSNGEWMLMGTGFLWGDKSALKVTVVMVAQL